jgi:hypothetical protein
MAPWAKVANMSGQIIMIYSFTMNSFLFPINFGVAPLSATPIRMHLRLQLVENAAIFAVSVTKLLTSDFC